VPNAVTAEILKDGMPGRQCDIEAGGEADVSKGGLHYTSSERFVLDRESIGTTDTLPK